MAKPGNPAMSELLRAQNLLALWQTNVQDTLTCHSGDGVWWQHDITRFYFGSIMSVRVCFW